MIHLINRFFEAVGIDAEHRQLADGVCLSDKPSSNHFFGIESLVSSPCHQRTDHEILAECCIKDMPRRRIWMLVRVCLEQILLEGHVILRLVSKPLTVAVNDTRAGKTSP